MAPTRRRRMPAAQRREVILAAAEEAFAHSGYHGTSLDDVAHGAGVSKALIYEHFRSKRELHGSLLDAHAAEIFHRLDDAAARGGSGEQRLRSGIDAFLRYVEEHRDAWRALFRDAADPDVAALIARVQAQATGVIARLIAADPDAPANQRSAAADRDTCVEIHAQLLSGAVQSLATWWDDHRQVPRAALVAETMSFCWPAAEVTPQPPAPPALPRTAPVGSGVSSPAR